MINSTVAGNAAGGGTANDGSLLILKKGFVSYKAVIINKLSDRDVQNPNAGDALRQLYGNAEATQVHRLLEAREKHQAK